MSIRIAAYFGRRGLSHRDRFAAVARRRRARSRAGREARSPPSGWPRCPRPAGPAPRRTPARAADRVRDGGSGRAAALRLDNRVEQRRGGDWLAEEHVDAELGTARLLLLAGVGADHDDRQRAGLGRGCGCARRHRARSCPGSIQSRMTRPNGSGLAGAIVLLEQGQPFLGTRDGDDGKRPASEQRLEQFTAGRVSPPQSAPASRASRDGTARSGSGCWASAPKRAVKKNVVPAPATLSKVRSPPISRARRRLIASPRPVPPYWRDVELSACVNA